MDDKYLYRRDTVPSFLQRDFTDTSLYGDFSDIAAHKVRHPIEHDTESVEKMLRNVNIAPDEKKIDSVEAILTPLE